MNATSINTEFFMRLADNPSGPADSRSRNVTSAVKAAVRTCDGTTLRPPSCSPCLPRSDAKRLLALLAWSYARELYSSAEIHSRLRRNGSAGLWEGGVPSVADIRRFRTDNRQSLQSCLQIALRIMAAQKMAEGFVTRIDDAHIAAEAARRMIMAAFSDSAENQNPAVAEN